MLCQNCQKRQAKVHYTHIINNRKVEMHLCEQCAELKSGIVIAIPLDLNNMISSFMSIQQENCKAADAGDEACPKCGMKYENFIKTGKMGCSNCYQMFGDRLIPLLQRIHRGVSHCGKVPASFGESMKAVKEIENLKEELKAAICREEYEKAAVLRDKIKEAECKNTAEQKG